MLISLIIPVLNEEEAIPIFYRHMCDFTPLAIYDLEFIFCNDGSTDATEQILNELAEHDPRVKPLHFTRHFGKEAALFAGLEHATGDAIIPIDVDLQDPIEIIPLMLEKWQRGAEVVLAKRVDRSEDHVLKRLTAAMFYKIHNAMSVIKIEENVGDFRLLSREIVESIIQLPERNLFMKGILSWPTQDFDIVEYARPKRDVGKSKFNGWRLWNLALEGITSFSTVPLRIWTYIGFLFASVAFIYGAFLIAKTLLYGTDVKGYPSMVVFILFFGGIQLMSTGILGEYIGRIYIESKQRPRYILKKHTSKERR